MAEHRWRMVLFGGLRAERRTADGEEVVTRFRSHRTAALLAYLVHHRHQNHSREVLIELFWPGATLKAGRNSLCVALSSLRSQLEGPATGTDAPVFEAGRGWVQLHPQAVVTDVEEFEAALTAAEHAVNPQADLALLQQAVRLYTGDFLPGVFDDWALHEQRRLADAFFAAVDRLVELHRQANQLAGALDAAHRGLAVDPLRQQSCYDLMRLYADSGRPETALEQYETLRLRLDEELGLAPEGELVALAEQLSAAMHERRTVEQRDRAAAPAALPSEPDSLSAPNATAPASTSNTPAQPTFGPLVTVLSLANCDSEHDTEQAALRCLVDRHRGQPVLVGDGWCALFGSPSEAMACALALQAPDGCRPTAQAALHTGELGAPHAEAELADGVSDPLLVHAQRLAQAAHEGQLLCSETTGVLLRRDIDTTVVLRDLGLFRLAEAMRPEPLWQVTLPGQGWPDFPPPKAIASYQNRLPMRLSRFFGRAREQADLERLLLDEQARLVTLTGGSGMGKTRLATEVAGRLLEHYHGAVWYVPLADVGADARLLEAVAQHLDIPRTEPRADEELLQAIGQVIGQRPALLVVDNLEHLNSAGAELVWQLLERLPQLACLASAQRRLGLPGEREYRLSPLPTPDTLSLEVLHRNDSVRLFVDRVQSVRPGFQLSDTNAEAVAEICRQLDGLPLALELAAARAQVFSPSELLERLAQRLDLLRTRQRHLPPRHQTLRAALDWTFDLLSPSLRRLLCDLSVFRGGWTLAAAEVVGHEPLVLDALTELVDSSFVTVELGQDGEPSRYRMLESVRLFAAEQGEAAATQGAARQRHWTWVATLVDAAAARLAAGDLSGLVELDNERDNLLAAVDHTLRDAPTTALHLAALLWRYWELRGDWHTARHALERALAETAPAADAVQAGPDANLRAGAMLRLAHLLYRQGRYADAGALLEQAWALAHAVGDGGALAAIGYQMGHVAWAQDDYAAAAKHYEAGLVYWRKLDDERGVAASLSSLGVVASAQGDRRRAHALYEEALSLQRRHGDQLGAAHTLYNMAVVAYSAGQYAQAEAHQRESLKLRTELGDRAGVAQCQNSLGVLATAQGRYAEAEALHHQSLAMQRELGNQYGVAASLLDLGLLHGRQGNWAAAAALHEEARALATTMGAHRLVALALSNLGDLALVQGDASGALPLLEAAAAIQARIGDRTGLVLTLCNLGNTSLQLGDIDAARAHYQASQDVAVAVGVQRLDGYLLQGQAALAVANGNVAHGAALYLQASRKHHHNLDHRGLAESLIALIGLAAATDTPTQAMFRLWQATSVWHQTAGVVLSPAVAATLHNMDLAFQPMLAEYHAKPATADEAAPTMSTLMDLASHVVDVLAPATTMPEVH